MNLCWVTNLGERDSHVTSPTQESRGPIGWSVVVLIILIFGVALTALHSVLGPASKGQMGHGELIIQIQHLSISDNSVSLNVKPSLDSAVVDSFKDSKTGEPITNCRTDCPSRTFDIEVAAEGVSQTLTVPFECFTDPTQDCPRATQTLTLPLLHAAQQRYPRDSYDFNLTILFSLSGARPDRLPPFSVVSAQSNLVAEPTLWATVFASTGMSEVTTPDFGSTLVPPDFSAYGFFIQLRRPFLAAAYVLFLASVPLLLGLLFAIYLYSAKGRHQSGSPLGLSLVLAGLTLSVLPLHAALVPPEITALNLVDLLLGLGVAFLMALSLLAYARSFMSRLASRRDSG